VLLLFFMQESGKGTRNIQFELGKEALEVMLEGLQQIKQQLSSL